MSALADNTPRTRTVFPCFKRSAVTMVATLLCVIGSGVCQAATPIDLSGAWRFQRDDHNVGVQQTWFAAALSGTQQIHLPGTMDEGHLGVKNPQPPSLAGLYRPNVYEGVAWYQREIDIPAAWKGQRITLFLERCRWVTSVWVDGKAVDEARDSLIAPHMHVLGVLTPGRHVLTIRNDNTREIDLGKFVSVLYGGTPGNLNGIVGKVELRATPRVWIDDAEVYPDVSTKQIAVAVRLGNMTAAPGSGTLTVAVEGGRRVQTPVTWDAKGGTARVELLMGEGVKLWDEFSPNLYTLKVELDAGADAHDSRAVVFGMRDLAVRGTQFTINGRPLSLRGTLDCQTFPLTGYPPCDVESWLRIFKVEKSYGLNFIRFHSWCPPEAAFEAADREGVMIQVEAPQANVPAGRNPVRDAFTEHEIQRIVHAYGNHPSFCLMTLGNEYNGDTALLARWVDMLIHDDPRHLYSSPSCGYRPTPNAQWAERANGRGVKGPGTDRDLRDIVSHYHLPIVGHEIGQWTVFPNFEEMTKYTGVMEPRNFQIVRDTLQAKGMLDEAPRFVQATGMQAALLYKEEIEVLLRTPGFGGFSLLGLHDYPGQGTALVGVLDPFWDSKGLTTPAAWRRFCSPTVPLLRIPKRDYTSDETLGADVDLAHFGPTDLAHAQPYWTITDEKGRTIAGGALKEQSVPTGNVATLGSFTATLAGAPAPCKLTVTVGLKNYDIMNTWNIWVYPASPAPAAPAGVTVAHDWPAAKAALARGEKVLFFPNPADLAHVLPGRFLPVFWSPVWFPTQKPNTMGILCDPKQPVFAEFPTDFYSDWQWWDLVNRSHSIDLDATPPDFRPLVQVIDNFARDHKLGSLFEARVGQGRLMVCAFDLSSHLDRRPAARQLLRSIYDDMASDRFAPASELSVPTLDAIFAPAPPTPAKVKDKK